MPLANDLTAFNPEIWGGIECTINRIGDTWHDQLAALGHYARDADIGLLATLGIKALRYPILWEHHQPSRQSVIDWSWVSRQLDSIRKHDITPIAGLMHHGSGPRFTELLSPTFADDFARYAANVGARFPWLEHYTPINEPLTTARFSGLYGIWYPQHTDPLSFARMLLHQLEGIVKSMKAIRRVNPAARLIQTEDLGRTHSTPVLSYQAVFENHRRWLTVDFLSGKFDHTHPLWDYFRFIGVTEKELTFFIENPCPPNIVGVNYYVTSERFLDDKIEKYDLRQHGGNGRHVYADTEAVRVTEPAGLSYLLTETWERYRLPIAVTEVHLHCTREEQIRWLKEVWDIACHARRSGIDIQAVTAWALLGSNDWDTLLARNDGHYESGAFELNHGNPTVTAVGHLIRSLAETGSCDHPLLQVKGWWHRLHQTIGEDLPTPAASARPRTGIPIQASSLTIIGPNDPVVLQLSAACNIRGILFRHMPYVSNEELEHVLLSSWGVIAVDMSTHERSRISIACDAAHIPFSEVTRANDLNNYLNRLVDHSVGFYCETSLQKTCRGGLQPMRRSENHIAIGQP